MMNPSIVWTRGGFHHRVRLFLSGMKICRDITGRWVCPPLEGEMEETGLEEVEIYLLGNQNTMS